MTSPSEYKTLHLVDKESQRFLSALPKITLTKEALPSLRSITLPRPEIDPSGVTVTSRDLPSRDGAPPVTITIYSPTGNSSLVPGFLRIFGGGYVMGTVSGDNTFAIRVVQECGVVVVAVHYRLAPEGNKMDAVEDCYTALLWMHEHGNEVHIDKDRLAYGGPSAGGGLAAALGLLVRDRKLIRPIFQLLIYPMLDDRTCTKPPHAERGEVLWNHENNIFGWSCHLGDIPIGAPDTSYYIVPGRATDLSGLPRTFINSGSLDLFLEENLEFANKLYASGVPTELHVYPGLVHGGDMFETRLGKRVTRDYMDALRRCLLADNNKLN